MAKFIENKLIETFKDRDVVSREEITYFYRSYEANVNESTVGWRIHDLHQKNILKTIKRGQYVISPKEVFKPALSREVVKFSKLISERFDGINYCVWETAWLNEFSQHQSGKRMMVVEIEKEFMESLFFYLKEVSKHEVYLNPDDSVINYYIAETDYCIVIKKLISRSPIHKNKIGKRNAYTPALEKILVDIFSDDKLFYYLQGNELTYIYENTITEYSLNFTTLLSYAKRRGCKEDLQLFLVNNMYHHINAILDD